MQQKHRILIFFPTQCQIPISARSLGKAVSDWVVGQRCRNTWLDGSAGHNISKDLISSLEGDNFPSSLCSLLVAPVSLSFSHFTSKMAKLGIVETVHTTTLSTSRADGCQRQGKALIISLENPKNFYRAYPLKEWEIFFLFSSLWHSFCIIALIFIALWYIVLAINGHQDWLNAWTSMCLPWMVIRID